MSPKAKGCDASNDIVIKRRSDVTLMSLLLSCVLLNVCGMVDARFEDTIFYSPCSFNPMCICSNGGKLSLKVLFY